MPSHSAAARHRPTVVERFLDRCGAQYEQLRDQTASPDYGLDGATIGSELELPITDENGRPIPIASSTLEELRQSQPRLAFGGELLPNQVEFNGHPIPLIGGARPGQPFANLGDQFTTAIGAVHRALGKQDKDVDYRIPLIGILPTIELKDLGANSLSAVPRYAELDASLRRLHGPDYALKINSPYSRTGVELTSDTVAVEGANTSFQLHLSVPVQRFVAFYNAAQLAAGIVMAVSGNSPFFLGQALWDETRIPVFEQSTRNRAGFGNRWITHHLEPFADTLRGSIRGGGPLLLTTPSEPETNLESLRLLQSTSWAWNRAVIGQNHLRVEIRYLPAGPSVIDMQANAAFAIGLIYHLAEVIEQLIDKGLPFWLARKNFYQAALHGLNAELDWPSPHNGNTESLPANELVLRLLNGASTSLIAAGVNPAEVKHLLRIIATRTRTGQTGAVWQRRAYQQLRQGNRRRAALRETLQHYMAETNSNTPVHTWPMPAS